MRRLLLTLIALVGLALPACNSVGPRAVESARIPYNEAVAITRDQQLLLNLVRLKYRVTPMFLDVGSVSTQYEMRYGAGVGGGYSSSDDEGRFTGVNGVGSIGLSEKPTITYTPLQGDTFVQQIMAPIPVETVFLLAESGWSMSRIWRCCVSQINGIDNAGTASGPTPKTAPNLIDFGRIWALSGKLEAQRALRVDEFRHNDGSLGMRLRLAERGDPETRRQLKEMLGLSSDRSVFPIVSDDGSVDPSRLALETRSLLGVMFYLSHAAEVPQRDIDAGRVTRTVDADGRPFDWSGVTGDLLQIRVSESRPAAPYVAVEYRGSWFYIDDSDLESKTTFSLLGYLFALQAGSRDAFQPTLTLPVGG